MSFFMEETRVRIANETHPFIVMKTTKRTRPSRQSERSAGLMAFRAAGFELPAQPWPVVVNGTAHLGTDFARERNAHAHTLAICFCAQEDNAVLRIGHDFEN